MTKVVGDNYEIVIADNNILIRGSENVTIEGDVRHMIKGDYTMEVSGDYNLKVHGSRNAKVTFNDSTEITGNYNLNVKDNFLTRVGNNTTFMTTTDKVESIGGKSTLTVTGVSDNIFLDTLSIFSNGDQSITTNAKQTLQSVSGLIFNSQANWIVSFVVTILNGKYSFKALLSKKISCWESISRINKFLLFWNLFFAYAYT
jgi:hypothetical protein